jgi:carbon storage regulator
MLVTRRRSRQSVFIGGNVEVKILEIGPTWVKLGIDAPKEIPVIRSEQKLTSEENLAASQALRPDLVSGLVEQIRPASAVNKMPSGKPVPGSPGLQALAEPRP